jgi:hypothetical protein
MSHRGSDARRRRGGGKVGTTSSSSGPHPPSVAAAAIGSHRPPNDRDAAEHRARVAAVLAARPIDIHELRSLAPRGFTDAERRIAWPALLRIDAHHVRSTSAAADFAADIGPHAYTDQVRKDVERSFNHVRVRSSSPWSEEAKSAHRDRLSRLINAVMSRNPQLHYIQGFHDICTVFYLVCGSVDGTGTDGAAFALIERASQTYFRDVLSPTLEPVMHALSFLYRLLLIEDPQVHALLASTDIPPFFALSWFLTWFAHDLAQLDSVARLYDFFLASHALMPLYMACEVVRAMRGDLLKLCATMPGGGGEIEIGPVHAMFRELPEERLDVDALIGASMRLFHKSPPHELLRTSTVPSAFGVHSPYVAQDMDDVLVPAAATAAGKDKAPGRIRKFLARLAIAAPLAVAAYAVYAYQPEIVLEVSAAMFGMGF